MAALLTSTSRDETDDRSAAIERSSVTSSGTARKSAGTDDGSRAPARTS